MPCKPGHDLGVLVGSVVVEDGVDDPARRDFGLDGIEVADERLMAMTLYATPDDRARQCVEPSRRPIWSLSSIESPSQI